jgi:cold shock CspA family protein
MVPSTDSLRPRAKGANKVTGTIKTTVNERGFGFITDAAGQDYFFHRDDLADGAEFHALNEGDPVTFEPVEPPPPKGKRASQVQPAAEAPA